jgi:hypothetical protein
MKMNIVPSFINPSRMKVYFCHQNQNGKNIGNLTTLLKPRNIGIHLKGIETSFQVVPLFFKSYHFRLSCIIFSKYLRSIKGYQSSTGWHKIWNVSVKSELNTENTDGLAP